MAGIQAITRIATTGVSGPHLHGDDETQGLAQAERVLPLFRWTWKQELVVVTNWTQQLCVVCHCVHRTDYSQGGLHG